jgi:hypothetical protein
MIGTYVEVSSAFMVKPVILSSSGSEGFQPRKIFRFLMNDNFDEIENLQNSKLETQSSELKAYSLPRRQA